jgi:hypothetical protein
MFRLDFLSAKLGVTTSACAMIDQATSNLGGKDETTTADLSRNRKLAR